MEAATEDRFPAVVARILSDLGVEVPAVRTAPLPVAVLAVAAAGLVPASAPSPTGVAVQCLGSFRAWVDGGEVPPAAWGKSKALRVFKFLLANRRRWVPVEGLLDALWPDLEPEAASANSRVDLHHARRALSGAAEGEDGRWGHRVLLRGHKRYRVDASALA